MALVAPISADADDGIAPVAAVETKATLTLPSGWCCGFAHRRAEDADGRSDVETVFVTRGGLRMTFRRESDRPQKDRRSTAPTRSGSDAVPAARGSRVDLLV
jgi:hypothetical protein